MVALDSWLLIQNPFCYSEHRNNWHWMSNILFDVVFWGHAFCMFRLHLCRHTGSYSEIGREKKREMTSKMLQLVPLFIIHNSFSWNINFKSVLCYNRMSCQHISHLMLFMKWSGETKPGFSSTKCWMNLTVHSIHPFVSYPVYVVSNIHTN